MPTGPVLRIALRGLVWAVLVGPAVFICLLLTPLVALGRAGQIPGVVLIGLLSSAPVTATCGLVGVAAALLAARKAQAWTARRWLLAGMVGGAVISIIARLTLAVSEHSLLEVSERLRWTFLAHLIPGAAIGAAFVLTSLQDLATLSEYRDA